jgi:DNA-binding NarL/FixJ family response regulator
VVPLHPSRQDAGASPIGTLTFDGCRYAVLVAPPEPVESDLLALLTPRELQIATLIAGGHDNKLIARRLSISGYTVGAHVARIYAKLGMHKRTELTARVVRRLAQT